MSALLSLLLLGPPQPVRQVGVAWHRPGRVASATKARLRSEIASREGIPAARIVENAVRQAQVRRAFVIDPGDAVRLSDLTARFDLAEARFRAGELDKAREDVAILLDRLRDSAVLPGVPRLAWRARVLLGRIAWAADDVTEASAQLRLAVSLDNDAQLSTRKAPPDFAAAYAQERRALLAGRDSWLPLSIEMSSSGGADAQIEVDGVPMPDRVGPGTHYLIVRWPGAPPVGVVAQAGTPVAVQRPDVDVPADLPVDRVSAQRICDVLGLDELVLARLRQGRVGVQSFVCGAGFGSAWYSLDPATEPDTWTDPDALAGLAPQRASGHRAQLLDAVPWPERPRERIAASNGALIGDGPVDTQEPKKVWYRRAWIWVVIGGVVAGGITTGVVLGTRPDSRTVSVDGDEFLQ